MMKNMLIACIAAGIALAGIAGCSDDAPTQVIEGTQVLSYKKGDKFTYKVYDRDTLNANITNPDSVKTETWEVVDTNLTIYGQTGVTAFLVTQNGATTTDTVYMISQASGRLLQYDVLAKMVSRISVASAFSAAVPHQWVSISDTKLTTSGPLETSDTLFPMTVPVTGLGNVDASVTLALTPSHKGKLSTPLTAADSSYSNVFQTDHSLHVTATAKAGGGTVDLGEVINDSLHLHFDVGIKPGLIRQTLDSKKVAVENLGDLTVMGFERVLISYTRK